MQSMHARQTSLPNKDHCVTIKKPQYPSPTRRSFIARSVAALAVSPFAFPSLTYGKTMTTSDDAVLVAQAPAARQADQNAIRPFTYRAPQSELDDLRRRIAATRFPENEPWCAPELRVQHPDSATDFTQGVKLATMQKLAQYWAKEYDWRKVEARMSALPQFITEIDGLDIHFIHVRSKHENALPVIVTHGWPGSVIEQLKIIDPLVNPTAHGGKASDAFHVVVPSMPGYGFSGKPTKTGWGPERIARAWAVLMKRIGYTEYVAQGGDWGALIVDMMGVQAAPELLAIHTNMAGAVPPAIDQAAFTGAQPPAGLSAEERHAFDQLAFFYKHGLAYAQEMGNRPQTLYGVADSPVGLAAWILDHDARSLELITRVFDGQTEGLTRDDVLDNITYYWLTNTGVSSSRLYWENRLAFFAPKNVAIPVAVSVFPDELYVAPRSWVERAYPKLVHYNKLDKGGHFAAFEQPALLVSEMRVGFRSLRT
jgi:pimeloyl-ACP methyl ester carboxylesterase